jgi:hypothetical protein
MPKQVEWSDHRRVERRGRPARDDPRRDVARQGRIERRLVDKRQDAGAVRRKIGIRVVATWLSTVLVAADAAQLDSTPRHANRLDECLCITNSLCAHRTTMRYPR